MTRGSPFLQDRFEHERSHLYYLPRPLYERVEQPKPAYLIGSRGTGKTTLLKALNWRERLTNKWLREELNGEPFAKFCLGVYLKLPEYKLGTIDRWATAEPDDRYGIIVGLYLDLIMLEVLLEGVAGLISAGVLVSDPADEGQAVERIMADSDARRLTLVAPKGQPKSLRQLRAFFADQREQLERHATARTPLNSVFSCIPVSQMGTLGRSVAKQLAQLCDGRGQSSPRWYFKPCLDESETLNNRQQLVLNTSVRLGAWPLFPIAAFVREPLEAVRTQAEGLTLAQTDRDLIRLDDTDDQEFRALAEGVATVRLRAFLDSSDVHFDVRQVLGNLDINGLLEGMLKQSVSREGRALLARAESNASLPFFKELGGTRDGSRNPDRMTPPIYQTFLVERLRLVLPEPETPGWKRRAQDSAELRKKIVAAYLAICREFRLEVRYASADMVLQMSDKRIRDFLSFVHEIHEQSKLQADQLPLSRIPAEVQHTAIVEASKRKLENIQTSGVATPTYTSRLIDGLGKITRVVQTEGPDNRNLVATERGLFRVDMNVQDKQTLNEMTLILREAAEAGYLQLAKHEGRVWRFRIHTSLAAAFSFSYRGAYYDTAISIRDLSRICITADVDERERFVADLAARLSGDTSGTMPLFET